MDNRFIEETFKPYLKDLYKDLLIRSNMDESIDKVTFIEYTKLPGIINDRLHYMFSSQKESNGNPIKLSPAKLEEQKDMSEKEKEKAAQDARENVSMDSFVNNFTKIFIGDLDSKMKFCF